MKNKPPRNFVAKHSQEINKPKVFRDRKKEYKRREKFANYDHEGKPEHQPYSRYGKDTKNKKRLLEDEEFEDEEDSAEEE